MNKFAANLLSSQRYVFWDFDGVIKDSVEVKSAAFEKLFASFGRDVVKKVRSHHEANGGMSRFDKLPIYIKWSGQPVSQALIDEYSQRFSVLVKQHVIESEWVPGVVDYLYDNFKNQVFFLDDFDLARLAARAASTATLAQTSKTSQSSMISSGTRQSVFRACCLSPR